MKISTRQMMTAEGKGMTARGTITATCPSLARTMTATIVAAFSGLITTRTKKVTWLTDGNNGGFSSLSELFPCDHMII
ncbi:hypothetical protein FOVG_19472 [Fusarium oxysporum f. sp. pisi HDV247]|uniref:Uncharacterized protein n=1 Tax=Fusarium oxysporum f. sp. pisi HDV247 TaxID=1080344 RepID=W9N8L4_FUSOX|nr:hypothetical protein FOVG_19472 [Fusarium oxysporum f. sp. pisi HDV247]